MKAMVLAAALLATSLVSISSEALPSSTVTLSERVVELPVDISSTYVTLSRSDYSSPIIKVLVPALAGVTILDHRNTGEGAPCLATFEALSPEEVIQGNPSIETANFRIKLVKQIWLDQKRNRCRVALSEEVEGKIRGFTFIHVKNLDIGERHPDGCR